MGLRPVGGQYIIIDTVKWNAQTGKTRIPLGMTCDILIQLGFREK
jgi:hypothetical protein